MNDMVDSWTVGCWVLLWSCSISVVSKTCFDSEKGKDLIIGKMTSDEPITFRYWKLKKFLTVWWPVASQLKFHVFLVFSCNLRSDLKWSTAVTFWRSFLWLEAAATFGFRLLNKYSLVGCTSKDVDVSQTGPAQPLLFHGQATSSMPLEVDVVEPDVPRRSRI